MTPTTITATRHTGVRERVAHALDQALAIELRVDDRGDARTLIARAGLEDEAREIAAERDRLLDRLTHAVEVEIGPLRRRVADLHARANEHERDRLANAPRIEHTFATPADSRW